MAVIQNAVDRVESLICRLAKLYHQDLQLCYWLEPCCSVFIHRSVWCRLYNDADSAGEPL